MSLYIDQLLVKARGQWPYILESAGIDASYLKNKHGACPICCEGTDRFRFDDKDGRGTYICNQCGAGDGLKLLMLHSGYNFKEALNFIERTLNGNPEPIGSILKRIKPLAHSVIEASKEKRKKLIDVWSQSKPIVQGDFSDRYLQARGIKLQSWSKSLRYHPNLPYYDDEKGMVIGKFPAMIALVQDQYNKGVSLHRTYLGDGCKANVRKPKKLMSPAIKGSILGGAIRLYPPAKDRALVLAEGIETALAIHIATGLSVWATVSALGMERIILPTNLSNVIIAVDNDHSGTGQKAAAELAYRLLADGKKVKCIMPSHVGSDLADLLLEDNE